MWIPSYLKFHYKKYTSIDFNWIQFKIQKVKMVEQGRGIGPGLQPCPNDYEGGSTFRTQNSLFENIVFSFTM